MVWKRKRGVLPPRLRIAKASLYDPDYEYKQLQRKKREGKLPKVASEPRKPYPWEMPTPDPPKPKPSETASKKPGRKKKIAEPKPISVQTDVFVSFG
jgi:hypothetical protein